jgi:hypothetical protein
MRETAWHLMHEHLAALGIRLDPAPPPPQPPQPQQQQQPSPQQQPPSPQQQPSPPPHQQHQPRVPIVAPDAVSARIERHLPAALWERLRPFQRAGVEYVLSRGGRALIADAMGLGKTVQVRVKGKGGFVLANVCDF